MGNEKTLTYNGLVNIFMNMPSLVLVVAEDGEVIFCNNLATALFDYGDAKRIDGGFPTERLKLSEDMQDNMLNNNLEFFYIEINSKCYKFLKTKLCPADGSAQIILLGCDVTDLKEMEKNLIQSTGTDGMTGILNRDSTLLYLEKYINDIRCGSSGFAVCYIDINDLKFINDTYGHPAGDKYIMTIVSIVKNSIRRTDIFGRMGGDEFLLILPDCKYRKIESIMNGVCARLEEINLSSGLFHKYSISYGISEIDYSSNLDINNILNVVDTKMYYMKDEYKKSRIKNEKV